MAQEPQMREQAYQDDAFAASLSLEEELLGKGYTATPLGTSLAAELQSATHPPMEPLSPTPSNSKLASMAMDGSTSNALRRNSDALPHQIDPFNKYLEGTSSPNLEQQYFDSETTTANIHLSSSNSSSSSSKHNGGEATLSSPGGGLAPSSLASHINQTTNHNMNHSNGILRDSGYGQDTFSDQTSPVMSPLQWSTFGRSRRSSFSSTWSSLEPEVDEDPFEVLKRQLEELNSVVWETKTLHKRLSHTLASADVRSMQIQHGGRKRTTTSSMVDRGKSLELIMTSVTSLVESKARDRERQTNSLRNLESALRKETSWMSLDALRELEHLVGQMKVTLYDKSYIYENPLPLLRHLTMETSAMTDTLEELKELMYVNKRQVTELNQRLRSIAKTVHEVRKDIRRINKFLEEKDDDDALVLEKGEVQDRVKEIMWGLDDLDVTSSQKIKQMQLFWEEQIASATVS
ncbi:hypothetical protein BCR42DRAFT_413622 [Absidia repens]|uniref:Uncharacterized protein n=1 Tax=Absidia repens TaxID=90262 RepID=A0A1X2II50_9FUNG|nr:hypothetical protein BCR42DRAFT_413622 [Absidia repens]